MGRCQDAEPFARCQLLLQSIAFADDYEGLVEFAAAGELDAPRCCSAIATTTDPAAMLTGAPSPAVAAPDAYQHRAACSEEP